MLTVLTSSTEAVLTTLGTFKTRLGIASSSGDDELERLVHAASDRVVRYLGYWPFRQTYRETIKSYGNLRLMTKATPIRGISTVYMGDLLVVPSSYEVEDAEAGFLHREQGWPWSAGVEYELSSHIVNRSEIPRFAVTYEAGWVLTTGELSGLGWFNNTGGRTLPYDLEEAALMVAEDAYYMAGRDGTISSRTVGDLSITYAARRGAGDSPYNMGEALAMLDQYRRFK